MRRRRLLASCAASIAIVTVIGSLGLGAVYANNRVTSNNFPACTDNDFQPCWADNGNHSYFNESLGPMTTIGLENAMWSSYNLTDLVISEASSHGATIDGVYIRDDSIAAGTYAVTWCKYDAPGAQDCDHWHIDYNIDWMIELGWAVDTPENREKTRYVACHETGHSVGLTHGSDVDPPMGNGDDTIKCLQAPPDWEHYLLGTHNVSHVNNHY